jgi:hypothetical protein
MTARTFFLGDWNPWIRDPIDVVRALLPAAARGQSPGSSGRCSYRARMTRRSWWR